MPAPRKPKRAFDPDAFAEALDKVVATHVGRLGLPERFVGADAALVILRQTDTALRTARGAAALELRTHDPKSWSWPRIGELVDVSPQRAQQYATQATQATQTK